MKRCWFTHSWGFPRRWKEFDGKKDVDVQRCTDCGKYRVAPVQFPHSHRFPGKSNVGQPENVIQAEDIL